LEQEIRKGEEEGRKTKAAGQAKQGLGGSRKQNEILARIPAMTSSDGEWKWMHTVSCVAQRKHH